MPNIAMECPTIPHPILPTYFNVPNMFQTYNDSKDNKLEHREHQF